jgi:hypothetical protein
MWSALSQFFRNLFGGGGGKATEPVFPLPAVDDILRDEYSHAQELEGPGGPITAREAYELAAEIISKFDPSARLTGLESSGPLSDDGQCPGWTFRFHLPAKWGQAIFVFKMSKAGDSLTVELRPFVAVGSALAKMMSEGQTGFVEQQWKVDLERHPSLPSSFADSGEVLAAFARSGTGPLPVGAVLRASTPPLGRARWDLLEAPGSKKSLYSLPIE